MLKKIFSLSMPKGYSKILLWTLISLSVFGSIMVVSASMTTFSTQRSIINSIIRQGIFMVVSIYFMIKVSQNFSFRFFRKYELALIIITLGALLATRLFETTSTAYNWLDFGYFTVQPSEFAKISIMIIIANNLGTLPKTKENKQEALKKTMNKLWKPALAVISFILIVFLYQGDLGSAVVMTFIALVMVLSADHPTLKVPQRILAGLLLIVLILVVLIVSPPGAEFLDNSPLSDHYMIQRITSIYYLFRPENITAASLQQVKGLFSFAYGGLGGVGLGNSIQKYGYLPAAPTDYILSIVVEEIGIWGFLAIAVGYIILIFGLLLFAMRVSSKRGKLFLIGTATYLFVHFVFNVGGVTSLLPLTGIPLLLISQGGSSLLSVFIAFGICQNIIARDNMAIKRKLEAREQ